VLLRNTSGNEILSFTYDDKAPWPEMADGYGYTLSAAEVDPTGDPNDYRYWMASTVAGGSPFTDDQSITGTEPVTFETPAGNFSVYPNPCSRYLFVRSNAETQTGRNHVAIISLTGSVVFESYFTESIAIDLQGSLSAYGLYIIAIEGENFRQTEKLNYMP
jgi:hypothetical protein